MVECSPATRAARVRFPADATFVNILQCSTMLPSFCISGANECILGVTEHIHWLTSSSLSCIASLFDVGHSRPDSIV